MNFDSPEKQAQYISQLTKMWENSKSWRNANPDKEALIAWNFPPKVAIIAPISVAIEKGLVRTNPAGLELLKALWTWEDETEPTVLMCRAVLELKESQYGMDKSRIP